MTDLVGINLCTFDGFGHGYVTDLMVWVLNKGMNCVHHDPKYLLHTFKIFSAQFQSIKSSCISIHNCHINLFISQYKSVWKFVTHIGYLFSVLTIWNKRKFWFNHSFFFKTEIEKQGQAKHLSRCARRLVRWKWRRNQCLHPWDKQKAD